MRTVRPRRGLPLFLTVTLMLAAGCSSGQPAAGVAGVEKPDLTVAVVPAVDSAGFFVALYRGLFREQGLNVRFVPAVSSETVIADQVKGEYDITGGNYVSYIQAQQSHRADLDIFAEGSVLQPGAMGIYTMPDSAVKTLGDLKGRTVAINAPRNIMYLLAASVLAEHGISPAGVRFVVAKNGFPAMPAELKGRTVAINAPRNIMYLLAASVLAEHGVLPADVRFVVAKNGFPAMPGGLKAGTFDAAAFAEPFGSVAAQTDGAVPLADLDQGATTGFPVEGYVVTKQWARRYPRTLAAFYQALEQGQEVADTDRAAVEAAFEALPAPLGLPRTTTAVMSLESYPFGPGPAGSVDTVRLQRVVDVMRQFIGFPPFNIDSMLMGG
jgi:NitT/TauT family transport system substrate-binding protein